MGRREKNVRLLDGETLLGARMRLARQSKGISLTKMAELLQYSKGYLSNAETSFKTPPTDLIKQYEQVLGIELETATDLTDSAQKAVNGLSKGELTSINPLNAKAFASLDPAQAENKDRDPGMGEQVIRHNVPFDEALLIEPGYFVGRREDLDWLLNRLKAGNVASIAALRGLGGIGKTSLAALAIRKLREAGYFCDGIAVVLCHECRDATDVLQRVLSRFDLQHHISATNDFADLSGIAYQVLNNKKVLVVLDNIPLELAIDQVVAPLHAAGATLLLTSRHILPRTSVPVDATRMLGLLSLEEALELFAYSFGKKDVSGLSDAESNAAKRIINAVDRHTLAVNLAGIYAADLHRDLELLADELEEDPQRVFNLPEGEVPEAVRRVFAWSLKALPENAYELFTALGAFPTPDFSRNAAITLAKGLDLPEPEHIDEILVLRSLVSGFVNHAMMGKRSDKERRRIHPLLHELASMEFKRWPEQKRYKAFEVLARYFADYANRLLATISDADEIASAIDPDAKNITYSLEWIHKQKQDKLLLGDDELIIAICLCMRYFWSHRRRTTNTLEYLYWAINAAKAVSATTDKTEDYLHWASFELSRGNMLQQPGDNRDDQSQENLNKAKRHYAQSLRIARQIRDDHTRAVTLYQAGRLARRLGDLRRAERRYNTALPILQKTNNRRDMGWVLAFLGQIKHDRGDLEEAQRFYKEALAIHSELGYRHGEGWVIGYLGQLALTFGEIGEAKHYYQHYMQLVKETGDSRGKGVCLSFLGEIALAEKEYDKAERLLREARQIFDELSDTHSQGWALNFLGQLALEHEKYDQARKFLGEALTKLQAVNDLRGEITVLNRLAYISQIQGDLDRTQHLLQVSMDICDQLQNARIIARTQVELGSFLIEKRGKRKEGCLILEAALHSYKKANLLNTEEASQVARKLERISVET